MAKGPRTLLPIPDGIAAHFGLLELEEAVPLEGGYHTTILRAGELVVRIEEREPESVAWEHELLAWLAPEVPEVVAPIAAPDGSTFLVDGPSVVSLLPYVDGRPGSAAAFAGLLARVHARGAAWPDARPRPGRPSYAALDWEHNDWWDWTVVAKPPELVRAFEHARAWIDSGPQLFACPVHGDPAAQNTIWRDGRLVGLVDWEWARLDWPAVEVALAAWTFADDGRDEFVAAYLDAGGPGEPTALEEGRRIGLLANALYALTRGDSDRAWVAYLLDELRELP